MDHMVMAAMSKWPNVPDCYGWLALDERGQWWMRDAAAQAAGPFAGPGASQASKGSLLAHEGLVAFIGRNYACDEQGCWFFQNGPQRVFVTLANTPWVLRLDAKNGRCLWTTHTGQSVEPSAVWQDEFGKVYARTALGVGLLHSLDLDTFVQHGGAWVGQAFTSEQRSSEMPDALGFVREPLAQAR